MVSRRKVEERASRKWHRGNARRMRRGETDAERRFWWHVRNRELAGYKFKRQYLVGPYIADFVCLEAKLIVELDGNQHLDRQAYDQERDAFLRSKGFRVLRFMNYDLLTNTEGVVEVVFRALKRGQAPSP